MVRKLRSHSRALTEAMVKRYLSTEPIKKKCYKVPAELWRNILMEWILTKWIRLWNRLWKPGSVRRLRMFEQKSLDKI